MPYLFNDEPATLSGGTLAVNGEVVAIGVALGYPGLVFVPEPEPEPEPEPTVISWSDFEARFTTDEFDACTKYVYAVSPATGEHLYPRLVQGVTRAIAANQIDLKSASTAAVLQAMVVAERLTAERKIEILTP